MLYRLFSILLTLLLITACGKSMPQPSDTDHNGEQIQGIWLPSHPNDNANKQAGLAFTSNKRLVFVYPMQEGQEQAQSVHETMPLAWSQSGQTLNLTTITNSETATFNYALDQVQGQAPTLTLLTKSLPPSILSTSYKHDDVAMGTIQGSLFYRERMMLPPDAVAIITLQEVSRADAPAIIMSSMAIDEANRTPLSFQIPYIKDDIRKGHRYNLRACIMSQGSLLFSTTSAYPVLHQGQDEPASIDMLLHRVMSNDEAKSQSLQNTYWALQSLRGQAVQQFEGQNAPHLILSNDGKSNGSDGCNRFFGSYTTHEHRISFFPGGNTMMLCPQGDKQAADFMSSLQEATAYEIKDQTLELLRGKDVIARFAAQPLSK